MPDPIVSRNPPIFNEIFTGGTLTGIRTTTSIQIDDQTITFETSWDIPEEEQLTAEEWMTQKSTLGQQFVTRAQADTNLEYRVYEAIKTHLEALP